MEYEKEVPVTDLKRFTTVNSKSGKNYLNKIQAVKETRGAFM